jgi:hypothetical protein
VAGEMIQAIKSLITRIYQDTGIRVVEANQNGATTPPLPYGVYNITSPYIKGVGMGDISTYDDGTELHLKRTEQYQATISFTLYANDTETTINLTRQVREWFLFMHGDFIQSQNIAVVDVGNVENRTTFLVDSYDYKYGFDVQFRLTDEQIRPIDWFDTVKLKGD